MLCLFKTSMCTNKYTVFINCHCEHIACCITCIVCCVANILYTFYNFALPTAPTNIKTKSTGHGASLPVSLKRNISLERTIFNKMVDPKRVVSYEDMLKVIHQPEKVIIDVRNPDEVNATGKIPSSINIPLSTVHDALTSMSADEFEKHYQRRKPSSSDQLIFYCQSGRRSSQALDKALKLGFSNSKTYLGSWDDWSSRQK